MNIDYLQTILSIQPKTEQIRNISIIAHVDHGKTTLCDSLLAKAGIISLEDAGDKMGIALRKKEKEQQITIKATGISLPYEKDNKKYIINLVDSPGHVDFSGEVTAALRITDGALIVVDCVEGVCVQTETVARQALAERIKPVLHINKIDKGIMDLKLTGEELYQKFNQLVETVNALLATYQEESIGEQILDPRKGNVSFGSGKQGWTFTLPQFAKILSQKINKEPSDILKHLWGEEYFDPETKKITNKPISKSGKPLDRYVVHTVFNPIIKLFDLMIKGDISSLINDMLPKIGVKLTEKEKEYTGNKLIKCIMQKWLPAADALVEMIIEHLPSPKEAQRYRVESLYTGPPDDEYATAIRNCDPNGPLMIFISKMIDPKGDGKRFYAFGRVFSGTVKAQQEAYIMGSNYIYGEKSDFTSKKVPGVVLIMGSKIEGVSQVPCGNTVAIKGLDKILIKSGTISSGFNAYPISPMKFSVSPVVRCAVSPKNPAYLKKFTEALKRLENSDPCLQVIFSEKEFVIAGAGELHIKVSLEEFTEILGEDVTFNISPPIVGFCETITQKSSVICLAKSANKLNRLFFTAEPLGEDLTLALDKGKIELKDQKILSRQLVEKFKWEKSETMKIWHFNGTNCIVDMSHGIQYLNEIKDSIISAFELIVHDSVLCGEPLRGVRFNLIDALIHSDPVHRGVGQILPMTRRVLYASLLSASPTMVEPVYVAEILTEQEIVRKIYSVVSKRRGNVIEEIPKIGTPLCIVRANVPVMESFGLDAVLRKVTSGRAFPQLMFDHWSIIHGEYTDLSSLPHKVVSDVRTRKLMKQEVPVLEDFNDKL